MDVKFMKSALKEAEKAEKIGETPVGAVIVRDGKIITGTSAGCAVKFGLALVEALKGKDAADAIARQIVIR